MTEKLLPILSRSHRPQIGPRPVSRAEHAEFVKANPTLFETAGELPYAVFIQEDGAQFLTDFEYRPLWWRPAERTPARRCDPREYFDWLSVFWLHDRDLLPAVTDEEPEWGVIFFERDKQPYLVRRMLKLIREEFISGGSLWVRAWRPDHAGEMMGKVVERVYWRHGMKVIENMRPTTE